MAYMLGMMLDPLLWIVAIVAAFARRPSWPIRLAFAAILWSACAAIIYFAAGYRFGPFNTAAFALWMVGGVIWFGIFTGIRALWRRRQTS